MDGRHRHDADHHRVSDCDGEQSRAGRCGIATTRRKVGASGCRSTVTLGVDCCSRRSPNHTVARLMPKATTEKMYGPASAMTPSDVPTAPPTPVRFGPTTTPMVVAQTTSDSERATCAGSAESVAAYRDCRLDAEPLPNRQPASRSSASESICAATMLSSAPVSGDQIAGRQRHPAAMRPREPSQRYGEDRGAQCGRRGDQSGHRGRAGDVLGQQPGDREPAGHGHSTEHVADHQHPQGRSLQLGGALGRRRVAALTFSST